MPEWTGVSDATVDIGKLSATATVEPAKKWTIALIPHEHLDVGFTDYPAKVAELHSQSIDQAMDLIKKTPDFRWTLDGSWVASQYLNGRTRRRGNSFLNMFATAASSFRRSLPISIPATHRGRLSRGLFMVTTISRREYKLPRRCGADCGCAVLYVGLRFGSPRCGHQIFGGGQQQLARSRDVAWAMERKVSVLLGRSGWRARAHVVLARIPASAHLVRRPLAYGIDPRFSARFFCRRIRVRTIRPTPRSFSARSLKIHHSPRSRVRLSQA